MALSKAFFSYGEDDSEDILYVGLITTVSEHTEETGGIAGPLKASMALKHRIIRTKFALQLA